MKFGALLKFNRYVAGFTALLAYAYAASAQEPVNTLEEEPKNSQEIVTPAPIPEQPENPAVTIAAGSSANFNRALISTYQNNPRIKAQQRALAALDENVSQAHSGWLPSAEANFTKGKEKQKYGLSREQNKYEDVDSAGVTVVQPIFQGGETIAQTSRADNLVMAGRADLRGIEQEVLLDAITAYMDVLRDRSVLELSRNNEGVLQKQLKASRERFDVGEVTKTDVAQSEARLSRANSDTIQAEGSLKISEANFERAVGYRPSDLTVPDGYPPVPTNLAEAINLGEKQAPVIQSADFLQRSVEDEVDINIARLLPDLNLRGQVNRDDSDGALGRNAPDSNSLLLTMRVPLYQSGAEYSRVRQSKETASQRRFDLINAKEQTRQQVTQAWENLQTSVATIRSQQDAIRAAEVALDGVRQEHLYGTRTVLDVLDAEQELFTARVNLVRAERNRVVSIYTLLASVGGLTLDNLGLQTTVYNPEEHYDDVDYQFIGF